MIEFACGCGRQFKLGDEHAGRKAKCQSCGAAIVVPLPAFQGLDEDEDVAEPPPLPRITVPKANKEYKVLTQKDKWFSGKFDPETLERAINSYASQGWTVRGITTASIPGGFGGSREELIVLLER